MPPTRKNQKAAEKTKAEKKVKAPKVTKTPVKHAKHAQNTSEVLTASPFATNTPQSFGRVNVMDVTPHAENGFAPRVELGEVFRVTAHVFIEGRAKVGAGIILRNQQGEVAARFPMTCVNPGLDYWEGTAVAGQASDSLPWEDDFADVAKNLGTWSIGVEGWQDSYAFWLHDARIKISSHDDQENILREGSQIFARWSTADDSNLTASQKKALRFTAEALANKDLSYDERIFAADNENIHAIHKTNPLRDGLSESYPNPLTVERPHSSFSAWYQFFPRSEGAYVDKTTGKIVQGTLKTSLSGLDRAKNGGFDIVYIPPIFPVGVTNRKGKNNSLTATEDDPGSPFGIGSALGGHDTVDPLLGTMDDFTDFVSYAHNLGLEIALDFALQCSPDHPWVQQYPEWFHIKPDNTIAFAENPPKKYQDIYPIDFEVDMPGIEREVVRILELWIKAGVTIFRIDNPHTKPVRFWQDVIAIITEKHPEILFLAEAFTRPSMMRALSYVGFTQSHCYFPWRNTKQELEEYLLETNGNDGFYQHNTFWPTTPDILTAYLRDNGIAGHAVRAVLAAMGSPSWGIYNGFELIENVQRGQYEEHNDNEKYEIKVRDWNAADQYGISLLLSRLNDVRRKHPATRSYHNVTILPTSNENIIALARHIPANLSKNGVPDVVIVVVNLDGHNAQQATVYINPEELGLSPDKAFTVHDELTGNVFTWGRENYVSLAPWADVAHVLTVRP